MPYIKQPDRERIDPSLDLLSREILTLGELNYAITRLTLQFLRRIGLNYNTISGVIGTLTLIPVEIARRLVNPYEDTKIEQNGEVPEYNPIFWRHDEEGPKHTFVKENSIVL